MKKEKAVWYRRCFLIKKKEKKKKKMYCFYIPLLHD